MQLTKDSLFLAPFDCRKVLVVQIQQ